MNKSFVNRKVERIEKSLTRLENNQYCDLSIEYIISQIEWLWKFRYISHDKMEELADRVINIFEGEK